MSVVPPKKFSNTTMVFMPLVAKYVLDFRWETPSVRIKVPLLTC